MFCGLDISLSACECGVCGVSVRAFGKDVVLRERVRFVVFAVRLERRGARVRGL